MHMQIYTPTRNTHPHTYFIWPCVCVCVNLLQSTGRGQKTTYRSPFSSTTILVKGIELRLLDLAASTFNISVACKFLNQIKCMEFQSERLPSHRHMTANAGKNMGRENSHLLLVGVNWCNQPCKSLWKLLQNRKKIYHMTQLSHSWAISQMTLHPTADKPVHLFIASLSIIAGKWNLPRCPSTDKQVEKYDT